jgi:hypothetical protein
MKSLAGILLQSQCRVVGNKQETESASLVRKQKSEIFPSVTMPSSDLYTHDDFCH